VARNQGLWQGMLRLVLKDDVSKPAKRVVESTKKVVRETKAMGDVADKTAPKVKVLAGNFKNLAGAFTGLMVARYVARGIAGMVKPAMSLQLTLTRLQTITGATTQEMDRFRKVAFEVARTAPYGPQEVLDAMLELRRATGSTAATLRGISGAVGLAMASFGKMPLEQGAKMMADLTRAFGMSGAQATVAAEKIVAASRAMGIPIEDLSKIMGKLAMAGLLGQQSFDEMLKSILLTMGVTRSAERAGTRLISLMARFSRPKLREVFERLNIPIEDARYNMLSMSEILILLAQRASQNMTVVRDALQEAFGQKAVKPILALLGRLKNGIRTQRGEVIKLGKVYKYLDKVLKGSQGTIGDMQEKYLGTMEAKVEILKEAFDKLRIVLGEKLIPMLRPLVTIFTRLFEAMGKILSSPIIGWLGGLALQIAAIRTALWGVAAAIQGISRIRQVVSMNLAESLLAGRIGVGMGAVGAGAGVSAGTAAAAGAVAGGAAARGAAARAAASTATGGVNPASLQAIRSSMFAGVGVAGAGAILGGVIKGFARLVGPLGLAILGFEALNLVMDQFKETAKEKRAVLIAAEKLARLLTEGELMPEEAFERATKRIYSAWGDFVRWWHDEKLGYQLVEEQIAKIRAEHQEKEYQNALKILDMRERQWREEHKYHDRTYSALQLGTKRLETLMGKLGLMGTYKPAIVDRKAYEVLKAQIERARGVVHRQALREQLEKGRVSDRTYALLRELDTAAALAPEKIEPIMKKMVRGAAKPEEVKSIMPYLIQMRAVGLGAAYEHPELGVTKQAAEAFGKKVMVPLSKINEPAARMYAAARVRAREGYLFTQTTQEIKGYDPETGQIVKTERDRVYEEVTRSYEEMRKTLDALRKELGGVLTSGDIRAKVTLENARDPATAPVPMGPGAF